MPRFRQLKNNFSLGEVGPDFYFRTDLEVHKNGLETLQNAFVKKQGGVTKRQGTEFVERFILSSTSAADFDSRDIPEDSRIIPFFIDDDNKFLVVLTDDTNIEPDGIAIYDVVNRYWNNAYLSNKVSHTTNGAFSFFTGYTASQLAEVQYAQYGNLLVLVHKSHAPLLFKYNNGTVSFTEIYNFNFANNSDPKRSNPTASGSPTGILEKLSQSASTNGTSKPWVSVPYRPANISSANTITPAATTGSTTMTVSGAVYTTYQGGLFVKLTTSGTTGVFVADNADKISPYNISVLDTLGGTTASSDWEICAWRESTALGDPITQNVFPSCVAFFQNRLMFAGRGDHIWASQAGDIGEFMEIRDHEDSLFGIVSNDRPFQFQIASANDGVIRWLSSGKTLRAGTDGAEYLVGPGDTTLGIGPASINISPETYYGSNFVQAIGVNENLVFTDKSGVLLRELKFNSSQNKFISQNLNLFANHLFFKASNRLSTFQTPFVNSITYAANPHGSVIVTDNVGGIYCLSKSDEFGISAWSEWRMGGSYSTGDARVISTCSMPSSTSLTDEVWMLVKRTINSVTKVYLEKMGDPLFQTSVFNSSDDLKYKMRHSDSCTLAKPQGGTFAAYFNTDASADADYSVGTATGTLNNSATVSSEVLDCSGTTNKYVSYDANSNADGSDATTISFLWIPQYSGTPAGDRSLFAISKSAASANNLIEFKHLSTGGGDLRLNVATSAGAVTNYNLGEFSPTAGTEYKVVISVDRTNDTLYVWINDALKYRATGSIPDGDGDVDQLVIGTDYTTNDDCDSNFKYFIVANESFYLSSTEQKKSLQHIVSDTVVGLDHLAGETVQVLADGGYIGEYTVSTKGLVTLNASTYTEAVIGLGYETIIKTLNLNAGFAGGEESNLDAEKRVDRIYIQFDKTLYAKYGRSDTTSSNDKIEFRASNIDLDQPTPMFSGKKKLIFPGDYSEDSSVIISSDQPLPMTVNGLIIRGVAYD